MALRNPSSSAAPTLALVDPPVNIKFPTKGKGQRIPSVLGHPQSLQPGGGHRGWGQGEQDTEYADKCGGLI